MTYGPTVPPIKPLPAELDQGYPPGNVQVGRPVHIRPKPINNPHILPVHSQQYPPGRRLKNYARIRQFFRRPAFKNTPRRRNRTEIRKKG